MPLRPDGSVMSKAEQNEMIVRSAQEDVVKALEGKCLSWDDLMKSINPTYQHPIYRKTVDRMENDGTLQKMYVHNYPGPLAKTLVYVDPEIAVRLRNGLAVDVRGNAVVYARRRAEPPLYSEMIAYTN